MKRGRNLFRHTIDTCRLLSDGDVVLVGVSGGADSLCLLHLLHEYSERSRRGWRIHALHVDPGFPGWNAERVQRSCARIGIPCEVARTRVSESTRESDSICHACARQRRRLLFDRAAALGCRKVALGHQMDDVNETFLINLLFASSGATLLPRQPLFQGKLDIVRPLYHFDKDLVMRYLKEAGIRPVSNPCPGQRSGARARVRRFLNRAYREDRRIRTNLFWGLHNLKPDYLPAGARRKAAVARRLIAPCGFEPQSPG
jgi:tRNA 2-thiocytidine biosynthesis protein TtcA